MYALGVDIGGTKIAAGIIDDDGQILAQVRHATDPEDAEAIDRSIADAINELSGTYEVDVIGLAAAGFCSPDRQSVLFGTNIAAWREYPLARSVSDLVDKDRTDRRRIVVENDANAAGWAEFRYGPARDASDMLMLTVGTGLGGAIVINGELVRGKFGVGAEVGHMRIVPDGRFCGCGHAGCWEQYASGSALVRDAQAAVVAYPNRAERLLELAGGDGAQISGPDITKAAFEGDELALELFTHLGHWLGAGAASVAALLDPEIIVIGGGVCEAKNILLDPTKAAFREHLSAGGHRPLAQIQLASLGNEAGIVGAADLARR